MKPAINSVRSIATTNPEPQNQRVSANQRRVALVMEATPAASSPPIWEPTHREPTAIPTSSEVLHANAPRGTLSATVEDALIDIIMRPIGEHETHQTGNDNREREIRCFLASLSPIEAFALRKRLDADRSDDKVAVAFRRLLAERRQRLRGFLADPRRGRV